VSASLCIGRELREPRLNLEENLANLYNQTSGDDRLEESAEALAELLAETWGDQKKSGRADERIRFESQREVSLLPSANRFFDTHTLTLCSKRGYISAPVSRNKWGPFSYPPRSAQRSHLQVYATFL